MASLADTIDVTDGDVDDIGETETTDLAAAVSELASVLGVDESRHEALQSALEAVVLSIR